MFSGRSSGRSATTYKGKPVPSYPNYKLLLVLVVFLVSVFVSLDYYYRSSGQGGLGSGQSTVAGGQSASNPGSSSLSNNNAAGNYQLTPRQNDASQSSGNTGGFNFGRFVGGMSGSQQSISGVPAEVRLSESERLQEQFRLQFHQMLNERLLRRETKTPTDYDATKLLSEVYSRLGASVNFIQVGACDGEWVSSNDPIQRLMMQSPHWKGVLLEPVPALFSKLKNNVERTAEDSEQRLHLVNAALADENGQLPFYIVNDLFAQEKPGETHALKYQIGSFNKHHITKHLIKLYRRGELKHEVDDYIEIIQVNSMTPDKVVESFRRAGVAARDGSIDVLIIDAEGFDLNVLQSFMKIPDLRPPIVIYETLHMTDSQKQTAIALLKEYGYTVWPAGWNHMGVRAARVERD